MSAWEIIHCSLSATAEVRSLLDSGWEPFAVVRESDYGRTIWFRRQREVPA